MDCKEQSSCAFFVSRSFSVSEKMMQTNSLEIAERQWFFPASSFPQESSVKNSGEKNLKTTTFCFLQGIEVSCLEVSEHRPASKENFALPLRSQERSLVVLFFLSGEGRLKVDNNERPNIYPVFSGHYYVASPHSGDISLECRPNQKTIILKIDIRSDLFSSLLGEGVFSEEAMEFLGNITENHHDNSIKPVKPLMQPVISQLLYSSLPYPARNMFCAGVALKLITYVVLDSDHRGGFFIHSSEFDRIEKIKELLDHNLENPPSFRELSTRAGMSPTKLTRTFQTVTGTTPYSYLRKKRMARAMQLLSDGHMSVTDVSYTVGYDSLSYFSKIFFNYFGMKPFELKRNHVTTARHSVF